MIRAFLFVLIAMPVAAAEREFAPLPKPATSFGAAVSDDYVYVYGGHSGRAHSYSTQTTLGQFLRLNIAHPAKWEELTGGPILQGLAMVAHQGKIYRLGGMQPKNKPDQKTDTYSVASVARYDPTAQKWEDLPDMPEGRSSHDAVVVGGKIFVAGGWQMNGADKDSTWHNTALVLDLKQNPLKWESIEQPFKRRALTMAALAGNVYVIAGLNADGGAERTVNIYDPEKKVWSKTADIPNGIMNGFTPAACVYDGRLFLSPADGKLYRLTENGTAWDEVGALKLPRMVHRLVPIGKNQMLAVGGSAKGSPTGDLEFLVPNKDEKKDEERKGTVTGVVAAKGDDWIEIKADGEEKARRYSPYWRGGAPAAKAMVAVIKEIPLNSRVRLEWIFSERLRIEKIEILKKADDKEK